MNDPLIAAVVDSLERTPLILSSLIKDVPLRILSRRPAEDRWSIHEHVCHLANVHALFIDRLDRMIGEDGPTFMPYVPGDDEKGASRFDGWPTADVVDRLERDRRVLLRRLHGLTAEDWTRTAEHLEYSKYSVFILLRHAAMHDMFHCYRIEELALRKSWR